MRGFKSGCFSAKTTKISPFRTKFQFVFTTLQHQLSLALCIGVHGLVRIKRAREKMDGGLQFIGYFISN